MDQQKNKYLHSRYNPQSEADRYISSLSLNEKIRFCILIEPGLGYMIKPLRKKCPKAKIISLHVEEFTVQAPALGKISGKPSRADSEWRAGIGTTVQDFLEKEIPDTQADEIKILEWRPALNVYGRQYLSLIEEAVSFIKRADANSRTVKVFGRRWFKNFLKNTAYIQKVLCPAQLSTPLLVTGAGPGLESAIPFIQDKSLNSGLFVIAAASSLKCLKTGNITPNLVISTDGGNWAALHLYECFRSMDNEQSSPSFNIAVSMTAALPSQCEKLAILPISDGSLWQTLVLSKLNIPFITLPQRGTVSASALDLAFSLTKGDIFIAGMDLENSDIRSHARPYSFDRLLEEKAQRFNPVYSQCFKRSSLLKDGGSYGIYASWFKNHLNSYPRQPVSAGKNNPVFNSGGIPKDTVPKGGTDNKVAAVAFKTIPLKQAAKSSHEAAEVLINALNEPGKFSANLFGELKDLLFPGKSETTKKALIDLISSIGGKRGR